MTAKLAEIIANVLWIRNCRHASGQLADVTAYTAVSGPHLESVMSHQKSDYVN